MSVFDGFQKNSRSVRIAKSRLELLLAADRTNCTPDNMNHMRSDVLNMISRYLNINPEEAEICMKQQNTDHNRMRSVLFIQVPVENNENK
jgi:cell division topological specificity factor